MKARARKFLSTAQPEPQKARHSNYRRERKGDAMRAAAGLGFGPTHLEQGNTENSAEALLPSIHGRFKSIGNKPTRPRSWSEGCPRDLKRPWKRGLFLFLLALLSLNGPLTAAETARTYDNKLT